MRIQNRQNEIETLELQLAEKQILLQTFLSSNGVFQKTKEILQEIKGIKDNIEGLKSKNGYK